MKQSFGFRVSMDAQHKTNLKFKHSKLSFNFILQMCTQSLLDSIVKPGIIYRVRNFMFR